MRALVINLATEAERMAFQAAQLARLGLAYERLDAATPDTIAPPADDPYWNGWERPLRRTEMAALRSHQAAWERIAAENAPHLILEDDAVLMPSVSDFLDALEGQSDADLVTLETRGRRKRIARVPHPTLPMHRLWQDRSGAAAYVLWPAGARHLLARVKRAPGLADAVLCAAYELRTWQAIPALACQMDRCVAEGITPPIRTESAIDREARPRDTPSRVQRARRVQSQLRMGMRALTHARADNVFVPLKRD